MKAKTYLLFIGGVLTAFTCMSLLAEILGPLLEAKYEWEPLEPFYEAVDDVALEAEGGMEFSVEQEDPFLPLRITNRSDSVLAFGVNAAQVIKTVDGVWCGIVPEEEPEETASTRLPTQPQYVVPPDSSKSFYLRLYYKDRFPASVREPGEYQIYIPCGLFTSEDLEDPVQKCAVTVPFTIVE